MLSKSKKSQRKIPNCEKETYFENLLITMGQLKNEAFRNNRNVKDSKIPQFQLQMDKLAILIS